MTVMKSWAVVLCLMWVAGVASSNPIEEAAVQHERFATWDADGDGSLSRAEAQKVDGLASAFDKADANQDGQIDAQEYAHFEGAGQE